MKIYTSTSDSDNSRCVISYGEIKVLKYYMDWGQIYFVIHENIFGHLIPIQSASSFAGARIVAKNKHDLISYLSNYRKGKLTEPHFKLKKKKGGRS